MMGELVRSLMLIGLVRCLNGAELVAGMFE